MNDIFEYNFTEKEFIDNLDLNNYVKELKEDMSLTMRNIREKSLMVSSLRVKWLNYYFKEKENYTRIKKAKDEILKGKLENKNISDSVLRMKNEENISKNDEKIIKLNKLFENVKTNIDFLERAMNILNDFGFNVKNVIEIYKLQSM